MVRSADMRCPEVVEQVTAYLEGALAPDERVRFELHCRVCRGCETYLAETRLVVNALHHLRGESPVDLAADRARLLGVFRTRGPSSHAPREPSLPLGLGDALVALGDHVAYLWESDQEFEATADFLAAGLARDEIGVLVGHEGANNRVLASLERRGLDPEGLGREDRLHVASGPLSGDAILRHLDDRIKLPWIAASRQSGSSATLDGASRAGRRTATCWRWKHGRRMSCGGCPVSWSVPMTCAACLGESSSREAWSAIPGSSGMTCSAGTSITFPARGSWRHWLWRRLRAPHWPLPQGIPSAIEVASDCSASGWEVRPPGAVTEPCSEALAARSSQPVYRKAPS